MRELEPFVLAQANARIAEAIVLRREGDERASDVAHDALARAAEGDYLVVLPRALAVVGGVACDAGSAVECVRLLGAAATINAAIGRRPRRAEPTQVGADLDAARRLIGDEALDAAWSEGSRLTPKAVIEYAERARGERGRPHVGWSSLTPTELRVVALVADGQTNPQIAETLLMGKETVKTHLAHVFAKLGVSTRSELAARAVERRAAR